MVLPRQAAPAEGEFGWSLPDGDRPLSLASLAQLLPQVGINWIKFPVWSRGAGAERLDQIVIFAERLGRHGIDTVAVIDEPPADVQSQFNEATALSAADVFSATSTLWYPSLEPIMTRLSLQVKWWQLGQDDDLSFVGYPDLAKRIAEVKKQLRQFGQRIYLGFGWCAINEPLRPGPDSWDFTALAANPQLTDKEIGAYLPAQKSAGVKRWLSIEPLPRNGYTMETRPTDLIARMVAARVAEADAIFISRPFDDQCGLMNSDGSPGDLLLPWRTTAAALAGSRYAGSLELPGGSVNHVFIRGSRVVIVVWNTTPTREELFLGADARQLDIWGREMPSSSERPGFDVGPLPTFIVDASEPVVRWNLSFAFARPRMPSLFGVTHENEFVMKNYFPQGISGEVRLFTPDSWKTFPRVTRFSLGAGEELRQPFTVTLPFDVSSGRHEVRVEVRLGGERPCQFSIYRQLEVGLGDVQLEVASHLNANGELEVEQKFTNNTREPVTFKCMLFVPSDADRSAK